MLLFLLFRCPHIPILALPGIWRISIFVCTFSCKKVSKSLNDVGLESRSLADVFCFFEFIFRETDLCPAIVLCEH